ncbi:dystroglycan-like [Dorcoceras hygrometricum]|uniref:Dystroglycan-like n=1 Tax=Dorcoceras hygrometricum TaxID=472368 RepID=A0A2Z7DCX5_9LAMI|nr:dystroglycan-like [Dorcoceras hygrometricum]
MAASFYSNSVHVDFESALAIGEPDMVSMFQALIASGLQGFLVCPTVVYEEALVEFFANGTVRDGLLVSTVNGAVEISEKLFAETFDLPVDGLADISEMPKDKIFDARSIVSLTGEPVTLSGLKSQMKMHYRLLCDIMAKSISVKAESFNAINVEKFSLLTAVVCDVKMNWGSVLFGILKKMVSPGTKQAKGFAIQISLLLESVPNLVLGESSEFPSSKILTDKTIHRYIAVIDKSGAQELADAPKVKKAPKTKVASKKRSADIPLDVPVVKKKRTSKKKSTLKLVAVAQEAIPIQIVPAESAVEPMVKDQQAETKDASDRPAAEEETPADRPEEDIVSVEQRVDESAVEVSGVDVVDPETVVQQVLNQLDFSTEGQDVAKGDKVETWFDRALAEEFATTGDDSPTEKVNDEEIPWFVRPFISADHDNERLFETESDSVDTMDFEVHSQTLPVVRDTNVDPAGEQEIPVFEEQLVDSVNEEEMQDENVQSAEAKRLRWNRFEKCTEFSSRCSKCSVPSAPHQSSLIFPDDTSMHFDETDIATPVPAFSLPVSSTVSTDITRALNQLQASLDKISNRDDGSALKDTILMHLRDIEKKFTARFDAQDRWIGALRNDSNDQRHLLSLEINSSHRKLHTQIAAATIDQIDMQREVKELNAKSGTGKSELLHAQLSELVDYIHRGGADKKGESGSRGPQQHSNVQIGDSAVRPPTFAQRVDMAQRRIVETVLDADSNRESLERQAAAERDRERRRREARMLKRRRRF